jgi:hypothetical protein
MIRLPAHGGNVASDHGPAGMVRPVLLAPEEEEEMMKMMRCRTTILVRRGGPCCLLWTWLVGCVGARIQSPPASSHPTIFRGSLEDRGGWAPRRRRRRSSSTNDARSHRLVGGREDPWVRGREPPLCIFSRDVPLAAKEVSRSVALPPVASLPPVELACRPSRSAEASAEPSKGGRVV